jgi:hypothetical protein
MHYIIALEAEKYFYFLLIFFIHCGDGAGIPELVGDEDEILFLILVGYG